MIGLNDLKKWRLMNKMVNTKDKKKSKLLIRGKSKTKVSKRKSEIKVPIQKIDNPFKIIKNSLIVIKNNWLLFFMILLVYFLLSLVLVHGLSLGKNLQSVKNLYEHSDSLTRSTNIIKNVISSTNGTTATANVFQTLFAFIVTLAVIYSLREIYAGRKVSFKNAFYRGMSSLIPSLLILLLIIVEFLPLLIAFVLFAYFFGPLIHINVLVKLLILIPCLLLVLLSCYWITNSIIAFYISSLPEMEPFMALRSAKKIVKKRRLKIFSRIVIFPIILSIVIFIIMIPISLYLTVIATWAYFILGLVSLILFNSYMYSLYRELL